MSPPSTVASGSCHQSAPPALDQLFQRSFELLWMNFSTDALVNVADGRFGVAL
jgi:hypothetical protein